ncbi:response regulator [Brevundimonas sp.]|uniref:response regulator n=1 Tax=Brevundimonas sp. TaxID=1871086 RepID=UPI0028A2D099|nr:response regulator [Brevundimonas sp.]
MAPPAVIVVDDDHSVRDALCEYLCNQGFATRGAVDAREMDRQLVEKPADLIVLDLMLPGEDGLSICRRLARDGQAVLMLSALGSTVDRVVGLELGASDYLAKPFDPRELLARVRAVLRRGRPPEEAGQTSRLVFENWALDVNERLLLSPEGEMVALTARDYRLLRIFLDRPRRLLSRDQLLDLLDETGADAFDRTIDLAVSRLRRKLGPAAAFIETVRGEGYRLAVPVMRR